MNNILFYTVVIVTLLSAFFMFVFFLLFERKKEKGKMLNRKLLLIQVPRAKNSDKGDVRLKDEINLTEQVFSSIGVHNDIISLEAAIDELNGGISFYLSVPEAKINSFISTIEGNIKDSIVREVGEYNIFQKDGYVSAAYISQKNRYALPIRTYEDNESDTFSPIINALSKVADVGEGMSIQVIIKKAPDLYKKNISKAIKKIKEGESLKEALSKNTINIRDFISFSDKDEEKKENQIKNIDENSIKMLESKISSPLFQINYRIIASSINQFRSIDLLDTIIVPFSQFEFPLTNGLKVNKVRNLKNFVFNFSFRKFNNKEMMVVNAKELASIFHFPTSTILSPKINWLKYQEAPPPQNLSKDGVLIGQSNYRGKHKKVFISKKDRLRHVYIIGQTGTGKSGLLQNMAVDDIKRGAGIALLDPHGDLVEKISGLIPDDRIEDVIIFDPGNVKKPVGLNMLEYNYNNPEERTLIVNELMEIFVKLFPAAGESMGPMFQQYTRNALLLLMEDMNNEPATLVDVQRVFTDDDYRNRKLMRIKNPVVIDFWTKEATKVKGEASLQNITPYITSKFNIFVGNEYVRPIIGQAKSSIDFRRIMDDGKIFLANLSKGKIGDLNAKLLGMIITGKLLIAALSRADVEESKRKDFHLFIDEFQNFTTESMPTILSEARKYHLSLTVAHQFLGQLEEKTMKAVFGNVGSSIVFRVGPEDAEVLERQFVSVFKKDDLIDLDNFNAYVKLLIDGQTSRPFNIETIQPEIPDAFKIEEVRKISFNKYGKDRSVVDREILERLRT